MPIAAGNDAISKVYTGTEEVDKIYVGTELLYDNTPPAPTAIEFPRTGYFDGGTYQVAAFQLAGNAYQEIPSSFYTSAGQAANDDNSMNRFRVSRISIINEPSAVGSSTGVATLEVFSPFYRRFSTDSNRARKFAPENLVAGKRLRLRLRDGSITGDVVFTRYWTSGTGSDTVPNTPNLSLIHI